MERTDKILTRSQATSSLMDTAATPASGPLLSSVWGVVPVVASVNDGLLEALREKGKKSCV